MKRSRAQLMILLLALGALIALTAIQFSWILKAARMQEAQFNHSVEMAMMRIVETLSGNEAICSEVNNCLKHGGNESCMLVMKTREEWESMKSLIRKDLNFYGIGLDFEFDIVSSDLPANIPRPKNTYFSNGLEEMLEKSGYRLSLRFPEKRDFIIAQMGDIFIFSLLLLFLVTISFIIIYNFYRREKLLSESIVDFVNNVTHEFKTPLTNISLANSMLSKNEKVESDEKLSFYSSVIRTEQAKLNEKVEKLLKTDFAVIDKSQTLEEINAGAAVEDIAETFRVQIEQKGGKLDIEKEGRRFTVTGNPDLFYIALGNLVDNAVKYSGQPPEILVKLISKDNRLLIEINDKGPGIAREFRDKVFEKYFRVPAGNTHNVDGFGLGLYQVRGIIAGMKGNIKISNRKEGGLAVMIDLPLAPGNE
ncbi:MAG: HAMP domain-containing sensor histidine kinase [Bacteroidales bacterium]|jgi:two-component system, OmpR family, phosphate regulon sensor histidine kinase PhoR|nr:HAMP domain-containing histidine kinase [Bacteroidales bacterium]MDX9903990.1 HAMP domain-containing sensor histidine kinase [Bacteroidales bacterium]HNX84721.1 HAMP domain-containing sensor histidine kinase [Bacteroidales bacterium]HOC48174.1 HAMP domain-containing sensor histidine kinase [Bacteroidales bacterium]HPS98152.1 HAMP domain-containing sensor histidine kinase [Bacteroidales bacterium]